VTNLPVERALSTTRRRAKSSSLSDTPTNSFGRVIAKRQTLASGLVQQVGYAYGANGLLASVGFPDGSVLAYQYDGTGRLVQLNRNGIPLTAGIRWNPLGQPTAWNWPFGTPVAAARSYDTAGRLTTTEFSSYVYNAAGRITSLTQQLYRPADADPAHGTIANGSASWAVAYDAVGRITGFNASGNTAGFGYDANGNRSSSTRSLNGQTTSRSYAIEGASNKLTGFSQTAGGTTTNVSYGYNANGEPGHERYLRCRLQHRAHGDVSRQGERACSELESVLRQALGALHPA
jgi:YD repeat-containing protein